MQNLLNFNLTELSEWVKALGEPAYRSQQLFRWIHQIGEVDFEKMTNLSKV
jgi:23S rRNA (adenine2503-C2)-methyltransferase